ncbi:hypothetical protein MC885_021803, partial [Smutsia gigantea]
MPPAAPSVARSLGGRERARLGQRRRRPGTSMSPRRALPRRLSLRLCLCLCLAAAAARGATQPDITVMSAFNLLHLVTKSQPVALRACGLPS